MGIDRVTDSELKELVRSQAARRATSLKPCLSEEVLRRAAERQLDPGERQAVAAHLAVCADCVRDYRIAHSVKVWAEHAAASKGLLPVASLTTQESTPVPSPPTTRSYGWPGLAVYRRLLPYAIAALLIATTAFAVRLMLLRHRGDRSEVARLSSQLADRDRAINDLQKSLDEARSSSRPAGAESVPVKPQPSTSEAAKPTGDQGRIAQLEKAVKDLSRPRLNVPIVDLEPSGARGESAASITTIEVPRTAGLFTLILHTSGTPDSAGYSFEILRTDGKLAFRGRGIKSTPDTGLTLALSRRLIPAGKYIINLYAPHGDHTEPIERYVVEVHYR